MLPGLHLTCNSYLKATQGNACFMYEGVFNYTKGGVYVQEPALVIQAAGAGGTSLPQQLTLTGRLGTYTGQLQ